MHKINTSYLPPWRHNYSQTDIVITIVWWWFLVSNVIIIIVGEQCQWWLPLNLKEIFTIKSCVCVPKIELKLINHRLMELWKVWFMIAQRVKEYKVEFSSSVTSGWSRRSKVEIQFNRRLKIHLQRVILIRIVNLYGKPIPIAVNEWLWVSDDKVLITFEGRDWSLLNRKSITTPSIGLPGINKIHLYLP